MKHQNIAAVSLKGGRKDQFFFSMFEYYPDAKRWFLRSLLQVKDEQELSGNEALQNWVKKYEIDQIVVDFPLSKPACESCDQECPGLDRCNVHPVNFVRDEIDSLLEEDRKQEVENPKRYEQDRNLDDLFDFSKDVLLKETHSHILSRSFKRRLKKGFLPYWNRSLDFWVWKHYYDQLLGIFNLSYDSFHNTSLLLISRFTYLRRHFPKELEFFESCFHVVLIELLRAKVIKKNDVLDLKNLDECFEARRSIIHSIEDKLDIFIYDHDFELLVKNPRAFESFILGVAGINFRQGRNLQLPKWTLPEETCFILPRF